MTMPTDNTLAVRAALESGGGAAETQLALLAAEGGDSQLQLVVERLTAAEINVIVADADMSKPSMAHAYITPEQFNYYGDIARSKGFLYVASGPLVRSSYHAADFHPVVRR